MDYKNGDTLGNIVSYTAEDGSTKHVHCKGQLTLRNGVLTEDSYDGLGLSLWIRDVYSITPVMLTYQDTLNKG